jgi:hypothetical protein
MENINQIEECYRNYIQNMHSLVPDGVVDINLKFLHSYNLLHYYQKNKQQDSSLTRYFHVIETLEKITLVNDQFIVWIVPEKINHVPITYTLIALNFEKCPQLEIVFVASGCYNSSRLILRVLEAFLHEIQETEEMLAKLKKTA